MNYFGCLFFAFVTNFLLLFARLHYVFYLYLKSIRYVYRKLILKFVDDESGLHHVYVMVNYNKLNLYLVDNIIVFLWAFAVSIIGFVAFD